MRVKICGITEVKDAVACAEMGADAVGFIFYKASRRKASLDVLKEAARNMPPFCSKVAVVVERDLGLIKAAIDNGADVLQVYFPVDRELSKEVHCPVIYAHRLMGLDEALAAASAQYNINAVLVDAFVDGQYGGTGQACDWDAAADLTARLKLPVILSGGLTPENVKDAISRVRPYAVDVASGVEVSPGKKDLKKVKLFIRYAKGD